MELFRLPAILDIEASGFGQGSYPIEIGVAADNGEQYSWLIRPEHDWTHWSLEAESLHGISREQLLSEGLKPSIVADELNDLFEGQVLYSDGWGFDSGWLSLLYYVARKNMYFKLETLPRILSEYQLEHWNDEKERLRTQKQITLHRAASDALLIQETYRKTYRGK